MKNPSALSLKRHRINIITCAVVIVILILFDSAYTQPDKSDLRPFSDNEFKVPFISTADSELKTMEIYSQREALLGCMKNVMQYSNKEIIFIENLGQIRDQQSERKLDILFYMRSQDYDMYITKTGITYIFREVDDNLMDKEMDTMQKSVNRLHGNNQIRTRYYRLDMEFVKMNKNFKVKKELAVKQQFNYYTPEYPNGISPKGYKRIVIENLYDNIDLAYYGKDGKMKYDFIVKAGADVNDIRMKYIGAGKIYLKDGSMIVTTPLGELREEELYTYSALTGKEIGSKYIIKDNQVQFQISEQNVREEIIIDPYRIWATYYGGSGNDFGLNICTDNLGNLYVTGWTCSNNFPTQLLAGAYNQNTYGGGADVFILKFNSNSERLWATYYGGNSVDYGNSICTDSVGNVYVTGRTGSTNFPTQILTGAYNQSIIGGNSDAFILKFDSSGVRKWATYYGGSYLDWGYDICIDDLVSYS